MQGEFAEMFLNFSGGDPLSTVLWFAIFILFMMFYPRIIIAQMLFQLDQSARNMERMTAKGKGIVTRQVSKSPSRKLKESINNFIEFFVITPVSLDPYGIISKLEHLMNEADDRYDYFVDQVAPDMGVEEKQNIKMGLSGANSLNELAKIVRHYVELVRKTKNLQLAMVLQMQLPMIERIAKALLGGTEALSKGWMIGDSIGPLIAAKMIGTSKTVETEKGTLVAKKKIEGRDVFIMKAKGPGGRLGKLGRATEKIIKRNKVVKIITIDAAAKLEGEKTGRVAEGVGVAIGGIGVDRSQIEDIAVKHKLPLDSVVVKMSQEEAITPIKKEILWASPTVIKIVEERIKATKAKGPIIIIGVGNTCGVGNNGKDVLKAEQSAKEILKVVNKREKEEKEQKKKNRWKNLFWAG